MLNKKRASFRKYLPYPSTIIGVLVIGSLAGDAPALTADEVLGKMNADQRFGYVSGVVDGLAAARWVKDKPDATGMQCIYDWYLGRPAPEVLAMIEAWFERHGEQQAGILLHVLIGKECPG
ncbi:MAG: hypothetical protein AAFS03_04780 [Pseudomonadota bacterium]